MSDKNSANRDAFGMKWGRVLRHSDNKSIGDVLKTFNQEQQNVLDYLIYKALTLPEADKEKLLSDKK